MNSVWFLLLVAVLLMSCGGGGSSSTADAQEAPVIAEVTEHQTPVSTVTMMKVTTARYSSLEVVDYPRQGSPTRVCVMEIPIQNPMAGEILFVSGEVEVTNDLPYAVEICRRLSWETGTGGTSGTIITPEAGENVSPQVWDGKTFPGQHHMLVPFSGIFSVPSNEELRYISLVMYAGGSSYTEPGDRVLVQTTYGHMSVIRFSP